MAIRQSNMERLQQELSRQAVTKQKPTVGLPKLGTVHEVMQGRGADLSVVNVVVAELSPYIQSATN